MVEVTKDNIRTFIGCKFITQPKESLSSYVGTSGYSGICRGDVINSNRTGMLDSSEGIGLLKVQKKTLDRVNCMRIEGFSSTGEFVRITNLSGYRSDDNEEWYEVDNLLDSTDFLDIV